MCLNKDTTLHFDSKTVTNILHIELRGAANQMAFTSLFFLDPVQRKTCEQIRATFSAHDSRPPAHQSVLCSGHMLRTSHTGP